MIQDMIMSVAGVVFAAALVPQVVETLRRRECGVSLGTSLPTALGLTAYAVCGLTLRLWWTSALWALTAGMWGFLAVQRVRLDRRSTGT